MALRRAPPPPPGAEESEPSGRNAADTAFCADACLTLLEREDCADFVARNDAGTGTGTGTGMGGPWREGGAAMEVVAVVLEGAVAGGAVMCALGGGGAALLG